MNKKVFAAAAICIAAGLSFSSCSNKQKAVESDSVAETVAVEEEAPAPAEEQKYGPSFFDNEANKAETATDSTYAVTASGLKYVIVNEGTGKAPKATDNVEVHYTGRLLDGTIFDSSYNHGQPITFPLNAVIAGWTEGLQLMKEGGRAVFYIPSNLAYGEAGTPGGPIGPNADLIFEVELLSVK